MLQRLKVKNLIERLNERKLSRIKHNAFLFL